MGWREDLGVAANGLESALAALAAAVVERATSAQVNALAERVATLEARLAVPPAPVPIEPPVPQPSVGIDLSDVPFQLNRATRPSGNPIRLSVTTETLQINTNDTRIEIPEGLSIGTLYVSRGIKRLWVKGPGHVGRIHFSEPTTESELCEDIVFEDLDLSPQSGLYNDMYAKRLEIINCRSLGTGYALYMGTHVPRYSDVLIYGCDFRVGGAVTACIRTEGAERVVIKNTTIATGGRHAIRFHGVPGQLGVNRRDGNFAYIKNVTCRDADGPGNGIRIGGMSGNDAYVNNVTMRDVTVYSTGVEDIDAFHPIAGAPSVIGLNCDNVWTRGTRGNWRLIQPGSGWTKPAGWTFTNSGHSATV